jgi:hypothetical protein
MGGRSPCGFTIQEYTHLYRLLLHRPGHLLGARGASQCQTHIYEAILILDVFGEVFF